MTKETTTSSFQHTKGATENTVCSVCKKRQTPEGHDDYKNNPNAKRIAGSEALDYIIEIKNKSKVNQK